MQRQRQDPGNAFRRLIDISSKLRLAAHAMHETAGSLVPVADLCKGVPCRRTDNTFSPLLCSVALHASKELPRADDTPLVWTLCAHVLGRNAAVNDAGLSNSPASARRVRRDGRATERRAQEVDAGRRRHCSPSVNCWTGTGRRPSPTPGCAPTARAPRACSPRPRSPGSSAKRLRQNGPTAAWRPHLLVTVRRIAAEWDADGRRDMLHPALRTEAAATGTRPACCCPAEPAPAVRGVPAAAPVGPLPAVAHRGRGRAARRPRRAARPGRGGRRRRTAPGPRAAARGVPPGPPRTRPRAGVPALSAAARRDVPARRRRPRPRSARRTWSGAGTACTPPTSCDQFNGSSAPPWPRRCSAGAPRAYVELTEGRATATREAHDGTAPARYPGEAFAGEDLRTRVPGTRPRAGTVPRAGPRAGVTSRLGSGAPPPPAPAPRPCATPPPEPLRPQGGPPCLPPQPHRGRPDRERARRSAAGPVVLARLRRRPPRPGRRRRPAEAPAPNGHVDLRPVLGRSGRRAPGRPARTAAQRRLRAVRRRRRQEGRRGRRDRTRRLLRGQGQQWSYEPDGLLRSAADPDLCLDSHLGFSVRLAPCTGASQPDPKNVRYDFTLQGTLVPRSGPGPRAGPGRHRRVGRAGPEEPGDGAAQRWVIDTSKPDPQMEVVNWDADSSPARTPRPRPPHPRPRRPDPTPTPSADPAATPTPARPAPTAGSNAHVQPVLRCYVGRPAGYVPAAPATAAPGTATGVTAATATGATATGFGAGGPDPRSRPSDADDLERGPQRHHRRDQRGRHGEQAEPGELPELDVVLVRRARCAATAAWPATRRR